MKFDRIHANHSWLACSAIIGSSGFGYWTSRVTRSHSSKGNPPKVLGVPCVKITFATSSQASPMLADARVIPRRADFEGEAPNELASRKVVVLIPSTLSCRKPSAQSARSELLFGHCHVRAFYLSNAPGARRLRRAKSVICGSGSRTEITQKM